MCNEVHKDNMGSCTCCSGLLNHVCNQAKVVSFEQIANAKYSTEFDYHREVVNKISEGRKEVSIFGNLSNVIGTFLLSCKDFEIPRKTRRVGVRCGYGRKYKMKCIQLSENI